jgi:hypothetical protein
MTYLINYLSKENIPNVAPNGMGYIKFDVNKWSEIKNNGELIFYDTP